MIKHALIGLTSVIAVSFPSFAAEQKINQAGKKFSEKKISVSVGDTVVFNNDDKRDHNILIKSLGFNSGKQNPGEVVSVEISKAGKHKVRCGIHPKMKMTIVAE